MYELVQAGPRSWYIETAPGSSAAKAGIVEADGGAVYLIDSGGDREAGRKIRQILEKRGWTLKAIVNTHSNADHIGGNSYLQKKYGCPVFAPGVEVALTRFPILEPAFLYGGFPPAALRRKFLLAEPSEVTDCADPSFPAGLRPVDLPGHFFSHSGVMAPDGTFFVGDSVAGEAALEKYAIPFIYDVGAYLATLSLLETAEAALFVPAHAAATRDIRPLAEKNRARVREIAGKILEICGEASGFETILSRLFDGYGLALNFEQYALAGSTLRSFCSWLAERGELVPEFAGNVLRWRRA